MPREELGSEYEQRDLPEGHMWVPVPAGYPMPAGHIYHMPFAEGGTNVAWPINEPLPWTKEELPAEEPFIPDWTADNEEGADEEMEDDGSGAHPAVDEGVKEEDMESHDIVLPWFLKEAEMQPDEVAKTHTREVLWCFEAQCVRILVRTFRVDDGWCEVLWCFEASGSKVSKVKSQNLRELTDVNNQKLYDILKVSETADENELLAVALYDDGGDNHAFEWNAFQAACQLINVSRQEVWKDEGSFRNRRGLFLPEDHLPLFCALPCLVLEEPTQFFCAAMARPWLVGTMVMGNAIFLFWKGTLATRRLRPESCTQFCCAAMARPWLVGTNRVGGAIFLPWKGA